MPVTIKSLHAASLANALLLISVVKMSGMAPQIKKAFEISARTMQEMLIAEAEPDSYLEEFAASVQNLLREI